MWSRDENVGQSDTGQASVPVDELYSQDRGGELHHGLRNLSGDENKMWKTTWVKLRYNKALMGWPNMFLHYTPTLNIKAATRNLQLQEMLILVAPVDKNSKAPLPCVLRSLSDWHVHLFWKRKKEATYDIICRYLYTFFTVDEVK